MLSDPGRPERANEDAVRVSDEVVVVVDGAGLPQELRAGCRHGVAWFARSVAEVLARRLADRGTPPREALATTIAEVAGSHGPGCDLSAGSPSATAVAMRTTGEDVELLVLCDSSVVVVGQDGVSHVSDDRLERVTAPLIEASLAADVRDGIPTDGLRRARHQRAALEATRNRPGGFWCVHTDPAAAAEALVWSVARDRTSHVVLASDGATRAFLELGTHTLEEFVADCLGGQLDRICHSVRARERQTADQLRDNGSKVHDDLTVVVTALPRPPR